MRAELPGRIGIGDQHRLVPEHRIDLARREQRLVSIRAGGDHVFAQDVVLGAGCRHPASTGDQVPQSRSGIGIADRDAGSLVCCALGGNRDRCGKIINSRIANIPSDQNWRKRIPGFAEQQADIGFDTVEVGQDVLSE
jgi:hypothetical protein